jgi:DNA-binding NtrC family response regulator
VRHGRGPPRTTGQIATGLSQEAGTGKEVVATLIHQSSRRKHQPFVAVSCALFSETLIESELFGLELKRSTLGDRIKRCGSRRKRALTT